MTPVEEKEHTVEAATTSSRGEVHFEYWDVYKKRKRIKKRLSKNEEESAKKKKNHNIVVRGEIFPQKLTALKESHPYLRDLKRHLKRWVNAQDSLFFSLL